MAKSESFRCQLEKALENDDLKDCKLEIFSEDGPSGGFLSETSLAKLTATNCKNERITFNVFIKSGKDRSVFGDSNDFSEPYIREVEVYQTTFPALSAFLRKKNASFSLDFIPKCFGAFIIQETAVVVLENLSIDGYQLHNHLHPMNLDHLKLIFENYAKLHATSFAMKDQLPEEYQELTRNLTWIGENYWQVKQYKLKYESHNDKLCKMLSDAGYEELVERWSEYIKRGSYNILCEIENFKVEETCLTQTDCWNNNFMFKYNGDDTIPQQVKLVDFQLCQNNSPVLDLCTSFYFTCGPETESHFGELLEHYYRKLTTYLAELGSDADKLLPFGVLKRHWRRFSIYLALKTWHCIHCICCDLVKYEDVEDKSDYLFQPFKVKDMDLYIDRVVAIIKHFCDYQIKYSAY